MSRTMRLIPDGKVPGFSDGGNYNYTATQKRFAKHNGRRKFRKEHQRAIVEWLEDTRLALVEAMYEPLYAGLADDYGYEDDYYDDYGYDYCFSPSDYIKSVHQWSNNERAVKIVETMLETGMSLYEIIHKLS